MCDQCGKPKPTRPWIGVDGEDVYLCDECAAALLGEE